MALALLSSCATTNGFNTAEHQKAAHSDTLFEGIDGEAVRKAMRANVAKIQKCYLAEIHKHRTDEAALSGKLVIEWNIETDGLPRNVQIRSSTINNTRMENCIVTVIAKIAFPSPKENTIATIRYPFFFRP